MTESKDIRYILEQITNNELILRQAKEAEREQERLKKRLYEVCKEYIKNYEVENGK